MHTEIQKVLENSTDVLRKISSTACLFRPIQRRYYFRHKLTKAPNLITADFRHNRSQHLPNLNMHAIFYQWTSSLMISRGANINCFIHPYIFTHECYNSLHWLILSFFSSLSHSVQSKGNNKEFAETVALTNWNWFAMQFNFMCHFGSNIYLPTALKLHAIFLYNKMYSQ